MTGGERRASTSPVTVTITVELGTPVTVRRAHVAIEGEGGDDRYLKQDLRRIQAAGRRRVRPRALRGQQDADHPRAWPSAATSMPTSPAAASRSRVRRTPPTSTWSGPAATATTWARPRSSRRRSGSSATACWSDWCTGKPAATTTRASSTACANRWRGWTTSPASTSSRDPENAVDGEVPVTVTLTPAKRSIYTAGLSYGTDSGAGVRLGGERRYLNDRGHKALAQLDYAETPQDADAAIPHPRVRLARRLVHASAAVRRRADRLHRQPPHRVRRQPQRRDQRRWTAVASLHALRERWAYAAEDDGDPLTPPVYRYATFTLPVVARRIPRRRRPHPPAQRPRRHAACCAVASKARART